MKRKIVLFDIDYTLFDAKLFRDSFITALQHLIAYEKDDFLLLAEDAYLQARKVPGNFNPEFFRKQLAEKINREIDITVLHTAMLDEEIMKQSLYSETREVLTTLAKDPTLTLGIFSAGAAYVQRPKIASLIHFFSPEHIHIYESNKAEELPVLLETYKHDTVYLIDDLIKVLAVAKQHHPDITTIWIKRGRYAQTEQIVANFPPDSIISSLSEVIPLLAQKEMSK